MRRRLKIAVLGLAWLGSVAAGSLPAQEPETPSGFSSKPEKPARKQPAFFHRPAKAAPAEQLAYAEGLAKEGRLRQAMKQYLALVHEWHGSPEAPVAQEAYARLLMKREDYEDAFDEFQYLFDHFAGSFKHDKVLEEQFKIANVVRTQRHGGLFFFSGVTSPERALPRFEQIVRNAPQWERAPEAQFMIGIIHEDAREYALAASVYEELQLRYPSSLVAAEAGFGRARCLQRLAKDTPRDEDATRNAIAAIAAFLRDYPSDLNADAARAFLSEMKAHLADLYYERAVFYDEAARKPEAAIIAYRDFISLFPSSERRKTAEERIKALQQQREIQNEK